MDASQIAALQSPEVHVRAAAAEQLCRLGSEAADAAVALVRAAGDEEEGVGRWASAALEDLGPPPAQAIEPLAEIVVGQSRASAYWAATLLGRLGPRAAPATSALAEVLLSWPEVGQRAAWALEKIGPSAASARTQLIAATKSQDRRLARLAAAALAAIAVE